MVETSSAAATEAAFDLLVRTWDAQQDAYICRREERFDVMLDVLELVVGDRQLVVVDLACGPGSLSRRVLERFAHARVVALDLDPVLLAIASHDLARYGNRCRVREADLADPGWTEALVGTTPDAVISTTALHWLPAPTLVALYARLGEILPVGGVFLNGDHLRYDDTTPTLRELAGRHDEATQATVRAGGAPSWDEWWAQVSTIPGLAELLPLRTERFAGRTEQPPTTVAFHLAALRHAGFTEASTVWQLFDDYVLFARR